MHFIKLVINESEGGDSCFNLLPKQICKDGSGARVEVLQCTCLANDGGCAMIRITDPKGVLSDEVAESSTYSNSKGECAIDRISPHQLVAMVMNNNCRVSRILSESGCLITSAVMEDGGNICWTMASPGAAYTRNLLHRLAEIGIAVKRKSTMNADVSTLLSDKQEEAVLTAFANGYYDIPRKMNMTELSEIMECSKSTLDVTLRNAERKIICRHFLQSRNSIADRNK
ncbi:MAG: helix-turn-helix domain-containing protein [Candidatus Methanoplasma sp.]|jgi:predicted DNA binding protein|nr:helix-turn-helix domain-containing protein [Candidatus Methanoplasma sp.]